MSGHSLSRGSIAPPWLSTIVPHARQAVDEEDQLEGCCRTADRPLGTIGRARGMVRNSMNNQLEAWRVQQDVIGITVRFAEAQHAGIKGGDVLHAPGEEHRGRA